LTQQDLVKLLRGTDLTQPEIADVLDTTTATVSMTIARLKRKDGAKAKGVGSGADQNGDNGEQVNG
jgi:transcriptional regulator